MDRDTGERDPGGYNEAVISFCFPNCICLLPDLFLSLPVFPRWDLFILALFLLCELFTHNKMDDEMILRRQRCNTEINFNTSQIPVRNPPCKQVASPCAPSCEDSLFLSVPAGICLFYIHVNGSPNTQTWCHESCELIRASQTRVLWCHVWITLDQFYSRPTCEDCSSADVLLSARLFKAQSLLLSAADSISKSLLWVQSSRCQGNRRPSFFILFRPVKHKLGEKSSSRFVSIWQCSGLVGSL